MALTYQAQMDLLVAEFTAALMSISWRAAAEEFKKVRLGKRRPKPPDATPANVKAALYRDYLSTPEHGWWTRDGKTYYRCNVLLDAAGEVYSFRKYGDFNNEHPIKVKFSTLVNRWKYFTNKELNPS